MDYARKFKPIKNPRRYSEKRQVNFEKDVILSFFIIRKLQECHKFSPATLEHKLAVYRYPCIADVNNRNFHDIDKLYNLDKEESVQKDTKFVCNQFIHGGAIYAYREEDGNWGGLYTCSDYKRKEHLYRIPVQEIVTLLEIAGNDYPTSMSMTYCDKKKDYIIKT